MGRGLRERKQQITPCEMMPPLYFLCDFPQYLQGRDVIWFIDNEAAVACLVKGTSREKDMGCISAGIHLMCAKLSCRMYFEWIPTESNASDGLSRDGIADTWSGQQGWTLQSWKLPQLLGILTQSLVLFTDDFLLKEH